MEINLNPIKLKNLEFILYRIVVYERVNAEDEAKEFFKKLGFEILRTGNKRGVPDFKIEKNEEVIYVEVKTNEDGLRFPQVEWIKNNPDKKVIAFYIEQEIIKKKHKKHLRAEEKKKKLIKEKRELILKAVSKI